jgi:hypothetical protein
MVHIQGPVYYAEHPTETFFLFLYLSKINVINHPPQCFIGYLLRTGNKSGIPHFNKISIREDDARMSLIFILITFLQILIY